MKGLFVVFEGIDGSGKSSVCGAVGGILKEKGLETVITAEPTTDEIGMLIRNGIEGITREAEALLFVADRAMHTSKMADWIEDGAIVLCDRYYASTLAYQAAPMDGKALDGQWLWKLNEPVIREPDITFLMDVSPEIGLRRVGARGELSKFERSDYLNAVRDNYLKMADSKGFIVMDAERPMDETVNEVIEIIIKRTEE